MAFKLGTAVGFLGSLILSSQALAQNQESFKVMTYNVENLFDSKHDEGKDDYTYLPLEAKQSPEIQKICAAIQDGGWRNECFNLDWNDDVINKKMANIAQVILHENGGIGADVVVLPEVENAAILERLRSEFLASAGYEHAILLEGQDERGIDVGIISRFPLEGKPVIHQVPHRDSNAAKTRGILEAQFKLPSGKTATVLGVHFPSPHNPKEQRVTSLNYLNDLAKQVKKTSDVVIAAGDFNITRDEQDLLRGVQKDWQISHFVGCNSCQGTNYFKKGNSWSFLDVIMVYKGSNPAEDESNLNWGFDQDSIRVANDLDIQKTRQGYPDAFDVKTSEGVSDHFPMAADIQFAP